MIALQEKAISGYARQVAELLENKNLVRGQRQTIFAALEADPACPPGYTFSQFETAIKNYARSLEGVEVMVEEEQVFILKVEHPRMKKVQVEVLVGGKRVEVGGVSRLETSLVDRRGGRPKGGKAEAEEIEARRSECLDWCAQEGANKKKGRSVQEIINEGKQKFGLGEDVVVDRSTVSKRINSGGLVVSKMGPTGATEGPFEDMLVQYAQAFADLAFPQTTKQLVVFANACLEGTPLGAQILATKRRESNLSNGGEILGRKWTHSFLERRGGELEQRKPVTWESNRAEWNRYENFETMYNNFEQIVLQNRIAVSLYLFIFSSRVIPLF